MYSTVELLRLAARAGFVPGDQVRRFGTTLTAVITQFSLSAGRVVAHHGTERTPLADLELVGTSHHPDLAALGDLVGQMQVLLEAESILYGRGPEPKKDELLDDNQDSTEYPEFPDDEQRDGPDALADEDPSYQQRTGEPDEPGEWYADQFD